MQAGRHVNTPVQPVEDTCIYVVTPSRSVLAATETHLG